MNNYIRCSKCLMDTSDPEISFDENGICNYCLNYDLKLKENVFKGLEGEKKLSDLTGLIKRAGRNKKYDCIIGVSGGVDSTYLAFMVKEWGLRPLAVHFDNGWNSELAVKNIENILKNLDIDLYTYVVNWEEFKDLQLAYLKASVLDIEIPTDHGFIAALYKIAAKNKIKFIITGHNYVTESVLPRIWYYNKDDARNLRAIYKKYGTIKLKTFPLYTTLDKAYYLNILRLRMVYPLNYISYNKIEVKKLITDKLGWRDYGGKHYESVFTRFYQGYILPEKFHIDKRKAHLSNLICSQQITRDEAVKEIQKPPYDPEQLFIDKEYIIKKLGLTAPEFEELMKLPVRRHTDFPTNRTAYSIYMRTLKTLNPVSRFIKNLRLK